MGIKDRLSDLLSDEIGTNSTDPMDQRETLGGGVDWESADPYEVLDDASDTDVAAVVAEMSQAERTDLVTDPRFMKNHWEAVESAIDESSELRQEFGQEGEQTAMTGEASACMNHGEISPDVERYSCTPEIQRMVGSQQTTTQSKKASYDAGVSTGATIAGANLGANTGKEAGETQTANAQDSVVYGQIMMKTCSENPDNCPTSKMGYYQTSKLMTKWSIRRSSVHYKEIREESFVELYQSSQETIESLQEGAGAEAITEQIEPLQEEIEQLEDENETLQNDIDKYEDKREKQVEFKQNLESYIEKNEDEMYSLDEENDALIQKKGGTRENHRTDRHRAQSRRDYGRDHRERSAKR